MALGGNVKFSFTVLFSIDFLWFVSGTIVTSHGKVLCPGLTLPLSTAYQTKIVHSFKKCFVGCLHDDTCRAISYRKIDGMCYYFNKLADDDCYGLIPDSSVKFFTKIYPYKCLNGGTKITNGKPCHCVNSYVDTWCQRLMRDCVDGGLSGYYSEHKLYTVKPKSFQGTVTIYCEIDKKTALIAHNGRYTPDGYFNRKWEEMKYSFGNSYYDYWAGLETLHILTSFRSYRMIVFVKTYYNVSSNQNLMYFMNFLTDVKVANETENYKISFSAMTDHPLINNLAGSVSYMNNSQFSTYDRDNDDDPGRHCANIHNASFWFKSCGDSNPFGTVRKMSNYLEKPQRMFFNGIDAYNALPIDFLLYLKL